jgi:hypothetical protein
MIKVCLSYHGVEVTDGWEASISYVVGKMFGSGLVAQFILSKAS